ncbi:MAG TPA: SIS domain-containing protein, partial [Rhodospirillales bacterium]|nr:SIS domain-containing protein [Rhodospirillales bacterium]
MNELREGPADFPPPPRPTAEEAAIATGRRVVETEAEALRVVAAAIGEAFAEVVALLAGIEGRVVVTGMGKSGHVARKIAATLASTGTPALYVHPAEASHGDLGMITGKDAVLALSNSGETAELRDLTLYTRRFHIPLVAMVGRPGSTLAEAADHTLLLP